MAQPLELSALAVLSEDIRMLIERMQQGTLASLDEHVEVLQEIHELERVLADCKTHVNLFIMRRMWVEWDVASPDHNPRFFTQEEVERLLKPYVVAREDLPRD